MAYGKNSVQQRVSQVVSLQAPTGGIDDITPLAAMEPQFCISMLNLFPGTGTVSVRPGYSEWATGLDGKVRTIMPMYQSNGVQVLFAATDAGVYDVSLSGPVGAIVHPLSYGLLSYTTFSNISGQYLIACNGVDPTFMYNGTEWITWTEETTPTDPGQISGVDPAVFSGVMQYKGRLWFVQEESLTLWYLDTDAVGGVAKPFYLGSIFRNGGAIASMATWSYDGGSGLDDKLVVQGTAGEIAIFSGNDPEVLESWQLDAVFVVGSPIGINSTADLGGDVLMLTRTGLIPLSRVVQGISTSAMYEEALTKRISRTLNRIVNSNAFNPDWQIINVPVLQAIVINIPATGNRPARQFVMNILTGAWCEFNTPARCSGIYRRQLYFGDDNGTVHLFGNSTLDGVKLDGTGGLPIQAGLFSAFNYFGDPTSNKHFKLARPIFQSTNAPSYRVTMRMDYDTSPIAGNPSPPTESSVGALWNEGIWDTSFWASVATVFRPWTGVTGIGFCAALALEIAAIDEVSFTAAEFVFEPGGVV